MSRGEIYYADMSEYIGCEHGGERPVLVIQNNIGNKHSPTTIVALITAAHKHDLPTHVVVTNHDCNLPKKSIIMLEQLKVIDKKRLKKFVCYLSSSKMAEVDIALSISVGLHQNYKQEVRA